MATTCFIALLKGNDHVDDPKLTQEVRIISQDYTKQIRTLWRTARVDRHYDRLEKYHSDFLDTHLPLPKSEAPPAREDTPPPPEPPIFAPVVNDDLGQGNEPQPGPSHQEIPETEVPFIEKVL